MPRLILEESRIDPRVRDTVSNLYRQTVEEARSAAAAHPVLVLGMRGNPFVRKARRALAQAGVAYHYLEYGSYLSEWRRRNALKMWTGWPTFPMVFVRGVLVGGAEDLGRLMESGQPGSWLVQDPPKP